MHKRKNCTMSTNNSNLIFFSVCQNGYFGQHCLKKCSETCTSCNHTNGFCDTRCHPGWKGDYCQEGFVGVFFLHFNNIFICFNKTYIALNITKVTLKRINIKMHIEI